MLSFGEVALDLIDEAHRGIGVGSIDHCLLDGFKSALTCSVPPLSDFRKVFLLRTESAVVLHRLKRLGERDLAGTDLITESSLNAVRELGSALGFRLMKGEQQDVGR